MPHLAAPTLAIALFAGLTPLPAATADQVGPHPVEVAVDGRVVLASPADTLQESLDSADVVLGAQDVVSRSLTSPAYPGARVEILRGSTGFETVAEVLEHDVVEEEDDELEVGRREVRTAGVDGVARQTFEVTLVEGDEVSRVLLAQVRIEPTDEVVAVGTKEPEPEPAPQPATRSAPSPTLQRAPIAATGDAASSQQIAADMVAARGWSTDQFQCLVTLWNRESNWNHLAENPSSGAYGIPQSLPGSKMASAGSDWRTNPATQITWGLDYIAGRYGTPCGALDHSYARGWY